MAVILAEGVHGRQRHYLGQLFVTAPPPAVGSGWRPRSSACRPDDLSAARAEGQAPRRYRFDERAGVRLAWPFLLTSFPGVRSWRVSWHLIEEDDARFSASRFLFKEDAMH